MLERWRGDRLGTENTSVVLCLSRRGSECFSCSESCECCYFDMNDAHVICKMLGFPTATAALGRGLEEDNSPAFDLYGTAPSLNSFVLDNLGCTGNEASVFDCQHNGEWNENCNSWDIAGVQCATGQQ